MPNPLPVMVLGRMAVEQHHAGAGLGKAMLREAMRRVLEASEKVGARALVVHAIDDEAVTFYTQFGFQIFPIGSLRSEEHTSELQSLMRISYAVFCLQKNKTTTHNY